MTTRGEVRSCNRVAVLLLCAVTIQWAAPSSALAWFGWLDKFSGPGPYFGALVDTRLFCVGEDLGLAELRRQSNQAEALATQFDLGPRLQVTGTRATLWRDVRSAWLDVVVGVVEINRRFQVIQASTIDAVKTAAAALPAESPGEVPNPDRTPADGPLERLRRAVARATDEATHASRSQNTAGAFWTTCSPDKRRRLSVELNGEVWWTRRTNKDLANNEPVRFVTMMPSVTYRLIVDPRYDVLDIGAAAGVYWFSSKGFEAFRGTVAEPVRLSLHGPSSWHTKPIGDWRRLAAAIGLRGSLLVVPRGFGAEAFNGTADKATRIPLEVVPSWGIFVNVNSLFGGPH